MTTGEGGMFVTDNDDIAQLARSLRNQGRDDHDAFLMHHHLGYNYRLSDINCALGLSQLQRLPKLIAARSQVASWYEELLADCIDYLHLPKSQSGVSTSWFVYVIRLADSFAPQDRDNILAFLRKHMIGCNHYFPPIHLQPLYREKFGFKEGMFPITERIADRTIALPFSSRLTRDEVERVCSVLREGIERQKM
jgi:perosamine synthetase